MMNAKGPAIAATDTHVSIIVASRSVTKTCRTHAENSSPAHPITAMSAIATKGKGDGTASLLGFFPRLCLTFGACCFHTLTEVFSRMT